jgi:3D (Asp-Asp-Asp) domain-containing protein
MNVKELFKSAVILVLGMYYHSYVVYMMNLAKELNEKNRTTNIVKVEKPKSVEVTMEYKTLRKAKQILKHLTATMYYPVIKQCDKDPLVTAGMYKINPRKASQHKWIAMSRNLLKRWGGPFDYGDEVIITNAGKKSGVYKVTDTMNKRYVNRIDILETEGTPQYKFNNIVIAKL